MTTPFDPCKQWLGIDAVDLVDPRRVLRLGPGESDPLAVLRAAEAQLARLRSVEPGPFAVARQALMKRVEEAREAVLQQISAGAGSAGPAPRTLTMPPPPGGSAPATPRAPVVPRVPVVPPVPPQDAPPVAAVGWPDDDDGRTTVPPVITVRRTGGYRRKSSGSGVLLVLIAALAAAAGALYWFKFRPGSKGAQQIAAVTGVGSVPAPKPTPEPTPAPKPPKKQTRKPMPKSNLEPEPPPEPEPEPAPRPEPEPQPQPRPEPEPPPAENTRRLESLLGTAAAELKTGGFAAARTAVEEAATVAMAKPSRDRVERWNELVTFAAGFADFREQALAAVTADDEYDIDGKKIGIVEIDDEKFVYRYAGKNKTTPRNRIPGGILMAIVTEWFDDKPANELYIGAYHATKEEPDLDKARAAWEGAQSKGADASLLLPLLEDPLLTAAE